MPLKYAYHPGNVSHSSAPEVSDTIFPIARSLNIELVSLDGATSCGAGIIRQANKRLQLTLNARTFAMAENLGLDIITPCATTSGNLNEDLQTLKDNPILLAEVNTILNKTCGLQFNCSIKVHHLLHVLVDEVGLEKVSSMVKNPINFNIAGNYNERFGGLKFKGSWSRYDTDLAVVRLESDDRIKNLKGHLNQKIKQGNKSRHELTRLYQRMHKVNRMSVRTYTYKEGNVYLKQDGLDLVLVFRRAR